MYFRYCLQCIALCAFLEISGAKSKFITKKRMFYNEYRKDICLYFIMEEIYLGLETVS
jgi:hypothetical protein